jgi:SAM-dependent methyltransferase
VRHRRSEREDAVVRVRREDDDPAHGTIIAALAAGEQDRPASGWRRFVPAAVRRRLRPLRAGYIDWRRRRPLDLGDLRRLTPVDANWGFERGTPIDRVYVERFIGGHAGDIHGRVLEIAAPDYTNRFGSGVTAVDVLMAEEGNPQATIVADLTDAPQIPDGTFECAIVTQTLQFVYDVRSALATLHRVLAPGGVLLVTVPGLTRISPLEDQVYGEWWHYTARSLRRLAAEPFGDENVEVASYGNVLAATGFLYGLAASDLEPSELAARDPLYEVVVGLRGVKRA